MYALSYPTRFDVVTTLIALATCDIDKRKFSTITVKNHRTAITNSSTGELSSGISACEPHQCLSFVFICSLWQRGSHLGLHCRNIGRSDHAGGIQVVTEVAGVGGLP